VGVCLVIKQRELEFEQKDLAVATEVTGSSISQRPDLLGPQVGLSPKMERVSEVLQFPVIIERGRPLCLELEPFQKFDFLLGRTIAE
jgi:hypothetical protein